MQIDAEWHSGVLGTREFNKALAKPGTVVFYEMTLTLFRNALGRSLRKHLDGPRAQDGPKVLILDDNFTPRTRALSSSLDGIEYTFKVSDLIEYVSYAKESLAKAHSLRPNSIEKVLDSYRDALTKGKIRKGDVLGGVGFSVQGVVEAASLHQQAEIFLPSGPLLRPLRSR
jgi:hypothetical protein